MNDEQLEMLWDMLTDEQLMQIKESGEMEIRYKQSLYAELLIRCLIDTDEAFDVFL